MGGTGVNGIGLNGSKTHEIPSYENHSNVTPRSTYGMMVKKYDHDQRYTYVNINSSDRNAPNFKGKNIGLRNIVTMAEVDHETVTVEGESIEKKGGLYFSHGYDAHDIDDVVAPSEYDNVNLDDVARVLIKQPEFELKMTGHADTSGHVSENQTLSENRLQTAQTLIIDALERQGLSEGEATSLYDERIAPHSTIIALGEESGPVNTQDETKHQGNRVVTFDLFSEGRDHEQLLTAINKGSDVDNHEHVVVINMGVRDQRSELDFFPKLNKTSLQSNQHAIADEDIHVVFKIDENRTLNSAHEFTLDYKVAHNYDADNTSFVIENDTPGAVTSAYNFENGKIDISVNGQVAINIAMPSWIDPAVIKVGQITSAGEVTVSPLTNLEDVAPISESKKGQTESNPLYSAANKLTSLSITAKHMYMEHEGNPEAYNAALEGLGFDDKVSEALSVLKELGINTGPTEQLVLSQYGNTESALYNPDQVLFPDQIYQILYESEVGIGGLEATDDHKKAVATLLEKVNDGLEHADDMTDNIGNSSASAPVMKN